MVGLSYSVQVHNKDLNDKTPYGNAIILAPYKNSLIMPGDTVDYLWVIETTITPIVRITYQGPNGCGKAFRGGLVKEM